jgi:hypothetical protein
MMCKIRICNLKSHLMVLGRGGLGSINLHLKSCSQSTVGGWEWGTGPSRVDGLLLGPWTLSGESHSLGETRSQT